MKSIYSFIARAKNFNNKVEVTMSTYKKADEARALLIMDGFYCTAIEKIDAHTDVADAVWLAKRIAAA